MTDDIEPPERRQRPAWKRLLIGHLPLEKETSALILVSLLDVIMTYILLSRGGFRESNPLAQFFIAHWGPKGMLYFKMAMTAFVCVITQIIALKKPATAEKVLNFATLIIGCVVIYSLTLYIRYR